MSLAVSIDLGCLIGIGKIGQATAKKVQALGMDVIYSSRTRLPEAGKIILQVTASSSLTYSPEEKSLGLTFVSEDELLARADILSLHCPLTTATRRWLNAERIAKMKDGAYIVNVSKFPSCRSRYLP